MARKTGKEVAPPSSPATEGRGIDKSQPSEQRPHILHELVLLKGAMPGKPSIAYLPSLQRSVIHGMSIGPYCENMAESYEPGNIQGVRKRIESFLERTGASPLSEGFLMLTPQPGKNPIVEITHEMAMAAKQKPRTRRDTEDVETDLRAEALVTTENVPLLLKPADCPAAIITGKTRDGRSVLALLHLNRNQVNALLVEQVVHYLEKQHGCSPAELQVGILPGMGPTYHTLKKEEAEEPAMGKEDKRLIDNNAWGKHIKRSADGLTYHLDSLGYILDQLQRVGVLGQNIEAYGQDDRVDTFALAAATPPQAFSQRWVTATGQSPDKNGRNLVVAQIRAA